MIRGAWDSACSWISSPSRRSERPAAAGSSAASSTALPSIRGVPKDWIGIKTGVEFDVKHAFPCIGTQCAERECHPAGTKAQGFRDYSDAHFTKETEWQHMCSGCASLPSEVQAWRDRYNARTRSAAESEAARQAEHQRLAEAAEEAAIEAALEEAAIDVALAAAEQQQQGGTSAAEPEAAADEMEVDGAALDDAQPPPVEQEAPRGAEPQPPRFMQHKEQRVDLGKPLWSAVAAKMPRVGHDGKLHMPQAGGSVDLKALRREFPALPFITPPPAAARAQLLRQSSADGTFSTQELREQVRSCFECEAVGVELAVCMYEVTARDYMMEDERYHVHDERGHVIGCKLFCPGGCCSNKLVLLDGVNLDHDTSVRFAYGNGRAIIPISRAYVCCNPDCPAVVAKSDEVSLQLLRKWTEDGLEGQSAKGKLGELKKLGAQFYGHDPRIMLELPRRVRAMYRGLLCWKQGGCDDEFAEKMLTSKAKLAELEADMQATARARERKALEDYLAFVRTQHAVRPPAERFFGAPASASAARTKWPAWRLQQMSNSLLHPTAHNIRVTLTEYHKLVKPLLMGDMIRRSLGRGASSDGTFRLMIRTKTDGQVLYIIIGEDGCIVAYYVLQSESWKELEPGLTLLNRRLERLGTIQELEEWWSDRCCDGAADPTKHAIVAIFPNSKLKRAPRKDRFHAINGVNKTGNEGVPDQKAQLGSDLFDALCEIPDSELTPVVHYLQRKDPRLDDLAARVKARAEYRHHGIIRSRSRRRAEQLARWKQVRRDWHGRARRDKDRGERSVIRPKVRPSHSTMQSCARPHRTTHPH